MKPDLSRFEWAVRLVKRDHHGNIDWTPELLAVVREMAATGASYAEAGHAIGVAKNGVSSAARRNGISFARPEPPMAVVEKPLATGPLSAADEERATAGLEPLPAGHPLTWGAISQEPWVELPSRFAGR